MAAAVLLAAALLLPWNLVFGVGIPGSRVWLFAVVIVTTMLAWAGLAVTHLGRRAVSPEKGSTRLRSLLAVPYLLVAAGFVVFALVEAVRLGGGGDVPPGIGPGLLVGLAGAILAAQPPAADDAAASIARVPRMIGVVAMVLTVLAVLANLYWRVRYPVQTLLDGEYVGQNIAVVATAFVYGGVALAAVLIGLRWLLRDQESSRLATVALGAATALGAVCVWMLGVGRDIDFFHGVAQTTSTAKVGFEGYVAWVAAAALAAPWILRTGLSAPSETSMWRDAVRKCLGLIALWCAGSALLRVFDLIVSVSLDLPFSPYDSVAMLAFDIVACAVALWLRFNFTGSALPDAVLAAAAGVLVVLMVCRVAVGVGLAPRILYSAAPADLDTTVYGNMLAQQITSTFDVVLCWVAIIVAVVAVVIPRLGRVRPVQVATPAPVPAPVEPATQQLTAPPDDAWAPIAVAVTDRMTPKIARATEPTETAEGTEKQPRITRVLEESTQRFAAGTTYTGAGNPLGKGNT